MLKLSLTISVTEKYRIIVSAGISSNLSSESPVLSELSAYKAQEIEQVNKDYGKAEWTITAKGSTKEEASAAADKKAIELFNSLLPNIYQACASVKTKFEAKRAELASGIAGESSNNYVKYFSYGGYLQKEIDSPMNTISDSLKDGDVLIDFEAIGGTQY